MRVSTQRCEIKRPLVVSDSGNRLAEAIWHPLEFSKVSSLWALSGSLLLSYVAALVSLERSGVSLEVALRLRMLQLAALHAACRNAVFAQVLRPCTQERGFGSRHAVSGLPIGRLIDV